tara:strand:+ start:2534 stop:2677 length:144 start_codon:yes stop_codon:yes gene_type:complete
MNYKFDHIAKRLLEEHGWIRVPWFIPQSQEVKKEDKLIRLEKAIKSK